MISRYKKSVQDLLSRGGNFWYPAWVELFKSTYHFFAYLAQMRQMVHPLICEELKQDKEEWPETKAHISDFQE